jgi:hypothetical protein
LLHKIARRFAYWETSSQFIAFLLFSTELPFKKAETMAPEASRHFNFESMKAFVMEPTNSKWLSIIALSGLIFAVVDWFYPLSAAVEELSIMALFLPLVLGSTNKFKWPSAKGQKLAPEKLGKAAVPGKSMTPPLPQSPEALS